MQASRLMPMQRCTAEVYLRNKERHIRREAVNAYCHAGSRRCAREVASFFQAKWTLTPIGQLSECKWHMESKREIFFTTRAERFQFCRLLVLLLDY